MAPARGQRRGGGGGRLRVCKPPPSLAREGRAADSPAGQFDGLRRTHPLCAVSSSSPGLRIQGPGLQNPRGHGLPCAAPGRTVGSSGGLTQSGGCSKRRSIPATVPAAPTPLARSAPPARCPGPISGTIYHVPLLRSPTTTPEPLPLLPLCPTALYHAMLWYTPSMRTRVPSFGQTFPNKVGPCQKVGTRTGARACAGPRLLHGSPRGGVLRRESFGKATRRLTSHTDDKEPTLTRTPKFLRSNDNRRGPRWHAAHGRPPQACGHHAAVAATSLLGYSCFALRDDRFNGLWH